MGEVLLDALIDTLKVLPFLLLMNLLIEFLEHQSVWPKTEKILKGPFAPLIGTAVGVVPQCGFSVVATELYGKRKIALGTILAVYIATSDEAIPIMLSSYEGVQKILPVLIIMICYALVVGYAAYGIEKLIGLRKKPVVETVAVDNISNEHAIDHAHDSVHDHEADEAGASARHEHIHAHGEKCTETGVGGKKALYVWREYFKHPLIHTATVVFFILVVNIAFGIAVYYIGEDRLSDFVSSTGYLQPLLAAVVGLIPNCAASVVVTELYVVGGLNLGGTIAGLSVCAGLSYAVLIRRNRPVKSSVLIIILMFVMAVSLGMIITALGF